MTRQQYDGYFGRCPLCNNTDGYVNVESSHWFFCSERKVMWCAGANVFSSWQNETEEEQKRNWDQLGLDKYEQIQPVYPEDAKC